jgi:hypothetical protein
MSDETKVELICEVTKYAEDFFHFPSDNDGVLAGKYTIKRRTDDFPA